MRATTIRQPWSWATLHGKGTENRGAMTHYRGDVALHAGHNWCSYGAHDPRVIEAFRPYRHPGEDPASPIHRVLHVDRFIGGQVLAVAELADCHRVRVLDDRLVCCDDPWAMAEFAGRIVRAHIVWTNIRVLPEPVPARGALGWWRLPDGQTRAVLEQLEHLQETPR